MSGGESLYKGMFTGHVSLHLHWNSRLKTHNMHALHCHRLLSADPYIAAEKQLRPCGQRRPHSQVNLSLFISTLWVEESEEPLTCETVSIVNLMAEVTSRWIKSSPSFWITPAVTGKPRSQLNSNWLCCSGPCNPFSPGSFQNPAGKEAA